jgi:hypothetical protein
MGTNRSVSRCARDVVGSSFFSGAVTLSNTVDDSRKVAMYGDCPQEAYDLHTWTSIKSVCVMCIRFL